MKWRASLAASEHRTSPPSVVAYDKGKQDDPYWAPLFKGYEPVARWLADKKPDVLVFFYNDHATTPHARYVIFEDSGLMSPVEAPQVVTTALPPRSSNTPLPSPSPVTVS